MRFLLEQQSGWLRLCHDPTKHNTLKAEAREGETTAPIRWDGATLEGE